MWSNLSRADDLIGMIKNMTSIRDLKSLQKFLSNEDNVILLRGGTVHQALLEIPGQIRNVITEHPYKVIEEIVDFLV